VKLEQLELEALTEALAMGEEVGATIDAEAPPLAVGVALVDVLSVERAVTETAEDKEGSGDAEEVKTAEPLAERLGEAVSAALSVPPKGPEGVADALGDSVADADAAGEPAGRLDGLPEPEAEEKGVMEELTDTLTLGVCEVVVELETVTPTVAV
jgi:hypothetical protein